MKDWRGVSIRVGATVVYPSRQSSDLWVTEGEVVSVENGRVGVRKIRSSSSANSFERHTKKERTAYPSVDRIVVVGQVPDFSDEQVALGYLGALIDGEGSVTKPEVRQTKIRITNTNLLILRATEKALESLGIDSFSTYDHPVKGNRIPCYVLEIWGASAMKIIAERCPIASEEKLRRIQHGAAFVSRRGSHPCPPGCTCGRHRAKSE